MWFEFGDPRHSIEYSYLAWCWTQKYGSRVRITNDGNRLNCSTGKISGFVASNIPEMENMSHNSGLTKMDFCFVLILEQLPRSHISKNTFSQVCLSWPEMKQHRLSIDDQCRHNLWYKLTNNMLLIIKLLFMSYQYTHSRLMSSGSCLKWL